MEIATIGFGCFWCAEAIFSAIGINSINVGYSGGYTKNPTYESVCSGLTNHAEVIQLSYNPDEISYKDILIHFFQNHDPTTLNRQGNDIGSQYRSCIFYHDTNQNVIAEKLIKELNHNTFNQLIKTEVSKFENFYIAEEYHQNYFKKNPDVPYCIAVIKPKINKLKSR